DLDKLAYREKPAILIANDGEIYAETVGRLLANPDLAYGTLLLPPLVGDLDEYGMVDWSKTEVPEEKLSRYDVSTTDERTRVPGEEEPENLRGWSKFPVEARRETDFDDVKRWTYYKARAERVTTGPDEVLLDDHQRYAAEKMEDLTQRLGLDSRTARILIWAVERHDAGKNRRIWQTAAKNMAGGR